MTRLGVWWWDGFHVADIVGHGREVTLKYTPDSLDRWQANLPVLSCSLLLRPGRLRATPFFRGLLPEGQHLAALAADAGLAVGDTVGLLARYGRDVAGALVIAENWPGERSGSAVPYSDDSLAEEVAELDAHPLGIHDDSELSIAGLQNKLLLVADSKGGWARPVGGAPSTHILKVDDQRHPGLVAAEAACMHLARHLGLTTFEVVQRRITGAECLIVARFDRRTVGKRVERVHQEDACQATGTDFEASRGRGKYESGGGPSLRDVARLLDLYTSNPTQQLDRLVATVTFTVLIGNADAHGKNVAVLHPDGAEVELAPVYDQVPTVLWPELRTRPAMSIGPRVSPIGKVGASDMTAEAALWGHDRDRALSVVDDLATRALSAVTDEAIIDHKQVAKLVTTNARRLLTHR